MTLPPSAHIPGERHTRKGSTVLWVNPILLTSTFLLGIHTQHIVTKKGTQILMQPRVASSGATLRPYGPWRGCIITRILAPLFLVMIIKLAQICIQLFFKEKCTEICMLWYETYIFLTLKFEGLMQQTNLISLYINSECFIFWK